MAVTTGVVAGAVGIQRVEAMGTVNFLQHIQDAPFHSYTHTHQRTTWPRLSAVPSLGKSATGH